MTKSKLVESALGTRLAVKVARLAFVLCVWLLAVPSCASKEAATFERRSVALRQYLKMTSDIAGFYSDRERAAQVEQVYLRLFGPAICEGNDLSTREASALFGSLRTVAYYTFKDTYIDRLYGCFNFIRAHEIPTPAQSLEMHKMLLVARKVSLANKLAQQHPGEAMSVVPEIVDAVGGGRGVPTELVFDPSRHVWVRRQALLDHSAQIIVVGSPLCHFSQDAARDITGDDLLAPIFRDHATWMTPQLPIMEETLVRTWGHDVPGLNTSLVYRQDEWPMLDDWMTPTFYLFRDGVLVSTVAGWPKRGRKDELRAALHQIGLL